MNVTLYSSIIAIRNQPSTKNKIILEGCANIVNPPQRQLASLNHNNDVVNERETTPTRHKNNPTINALHGNVKSMELVLERSDKKEPWGFRLQGGHDYRAQLSVKKIKHGSPSDSKLQCGDSILKINGFPTQKLSHSEAIELINCSNNKLTLNVNRNVSNISIMSPFNLINFGAAFSH